MADRDLTLPSYGARLREAARRSGLSGFWQWWRGELAALVPARPRAALARRRMRPVVAFAQDRATVWRSVMESGVPVMQPLREVPLGSEGEGAAAIAALAQGDRTPRVVLSLGPHECLRKRLTLPLAIEENLHQALAYDLDRHTPFKPEELYFDAVVVDRNPARGTIVIDLAAARRTVVDPALKHLAAWGAEVAGVSPGPPGEANQSRLNLLPRELRRTRPILRRVDLWIPLVLILAMAVAAVVIPLWQKREYLRELSAEANEARAKAAVSENLRTQLNAKVADYNFAIERKYAFPGTLAVVDTVSRILPDDTWLTQFEIKTMAKGKDTQRDLMLRGETANAGRLVQLFEESQMFAQAAQRGPTTKIQPGPGEIFDLGAQLKAQPAPPSLTLTVADPAAAVAAGAAAGASAPPSATPTSPAPPAPAAGVPPPGAPPAVAPPAGAPPGAPAAAPPAPPSAGAPPAAAPPASTPAAKPASPPAPMSSAPASSASASASTASASASTASASASTASAPTPAAKQ
ncbi:MAG: PilN domain-containing protein [Burkholderiales bacterium]